MSSIVPRSGSDLDQSRSESNSVGTQVHKPSFEGESIDLHALFRVIRRHVWMIIAVTVVILGVSVFMVLRKQPEYRAAAVIRLLDERKAITGGIEGAAMEQMMGSRFTDPVISQLQVLRSRTVAGSVVDELGLQILPLQNNVPISLFDSIAVSPSAGFDTLYLQFNESSFTASNESGSATASYMNTVYLDGVRFSVEKFPGTSEAAVGVFPRDYAIDWLQRRLKVMPRDRTDVIDVEFVSPDPLTSQRVVNTLLSEFRILNTQDARDQSRRRRVFIEEQLLQTDSLLSVAQLSLAEFQQREAVFSSREKFAAQQQGIIELDLRREELLADFQMLSRMLKRLDENTVDTLARDLQAVVSSPTVIENPIILQRYEQLVRLESTYDSLTSGVWSSAQSNPDVQRVVQLLANTKTQLVNAVRSHAVSLEARLAALNDLRARQVAEIQRLPETGAEEMRLVQRVETIRKMADQLREEYQRARISEAIEVGQMEIVDDAALPLAPVGGRKGTLILLGLVAGLGVGLGLAFLVEYLNTTVQKKEDIEEQLGLPTLAVIPKIGLANQGAQKIVPGKASRALRLGNASPGTTTHQSLIVAADSRAAGAESYRTLRTNLIFSQSAQSLRAIVVTSSGPGEGKTTTSSNLAATFAQQGLRVLIVDCDLRKPRQHEVFGISREPGLTQVLLGFNGLEEAVRETDVEGLFILPSGTLPPNPSDLIGGQRMKDFLQQVESRYDLIILDTCPLLVAADAAVLGTYADGVLLVVRAGKTDKGEAVQAVEQLRTVGAGIWGVVLNDPDAKIDSYGGYYYYTKYYGEKIHQTS